MSLLEGIGLCSSFILLLWAVIGIVPSVLALVAENLTQVLPGFSIWMRLPIVVVMDNMSIPFVSRMIPMESTIGGVAMGSVAASSMVIISTMVIVSSVTIVSSVITVIVMRGVLLERGLRMVLVDPKPSLHVLYLLHAILQDDSLVQHGLVVGSVGNRQRDLQFII